MFDALLNSAPEKAAAGLGGAQELKLPQRDWILLPGISLLTICLMMASVEIIGLWMYPETKTNMSRCTIATDSSTGVHAIPNTVCTEDFSESGLIEYKFNGCGHRAGMECGPKQPGAYRIVMVGSSIGLGAYVAREKSFAALLPAELSSQTGRKVELYNESFFLESPRVVALRFNEALAAGPDLILWILSPWDINNASLLLPAHEPPKAGFVATALGLAKSSRAGVLLQHLLYKSPDSYVRRYLIGGGGSGFLNSKLRPEWERHLHETDGYTSEIVAQARAAGVPVAVALVPFRAQAAMISEGHWLPGFDPYKLGNELRAIVLNRGGIYLDILPGFRDVPNTEQDFFLTDGHPNAAGHLLVSQLLAKELTKGTIPSLLAHDRAQIALEANR